MTTHDGDNLMERSSEAPLEAPHRMLTPPEFARLTGHSERTVRRWCEVGIIRAEQFAGYGGTWRIPRGEVDRALGRHVADVSDSADAALQTRESVG